MKIKLPRLEKGDRIGIVAPAGPVLQEEIQPGLDFLESHGFEPVCAPHLYDGESPALTTAVTKRLPEER